MPLPFRRRSQSVEPSPSRAEVMRSKPIRNPTVTWGPDARGEIVIHVPLVKRPWMERMGRFFPAPDTRHIILDDIGADVWQMCDGNTPIEAIRRRITEKYRLNHKEAEASLLEHLKQLARRKLIVAVAGADEPATEPHSPLRPAGSRPSGAARKRRKQ